MLLRTTRILYPHSIPASYPSFHIFLSCGEGQESEHMKWGKKYEPLFHMRQVQGMSQQKGYSIVKAGYRAHSLKVIVNL